MAETAGGRLAAHDDEPRIIRDRYTVLRTLGQGSSARTLLCADIQNGNQVAVKELHFEHLENWKYLELFEREAKVLARLDHPGIPKVVDYFQGRGADNTFYIVQEFIAGASLRDRMESGPMLGQQEVFDVALHLLDVLDYLHGRAPPVLHRDIKPSNVLVGPDRDAVLVDFGGVRFGWRPPNETGTTVVGTFGYMPPEQLLGQSGPTSDLYALGATLLHLLTGRPPSDFPFDTGRIEIPTDLPATEPITRLIEALLRPAPRDRPPSAAAARAILNGDDPAPPNAMPVLAGPRHPQGPPNVVIASGDGPRFVDMGPPPRDPAGAFGDVYTNLVNPLFPTKLLWSPAVQALAIGFYALFSVASIGIAPYLYVAKVKHRKRQFTDLFQRGAFTRGSIRSVDKGSLYGTFKYQFDVGGTTYVAFMEYAVEMTQYWGEGDTVPVLYDPDDPQRSCFVYR